MITLLHLAEKNFLVVASKMGHSKLAGTNNHPAHCSWPTDSYAAESISWVGFVSRKHRSVNEMSLPCKGMWQGTSIWRQKTARITCSALRLDGQGDFVHVELFATVDDTEAWEADASCCCWFACDEMWRRFLLVFCFEVVSELPLAQENWREMLQVKRRDMWFYQRKKICKHMS